METTSFTTKQVGQHNPQEMRTVTCLSHRSSLWDEASGWGNSGGLALISSQKSWHGAQPVLQGQVGRGTHKRETGVGKDLDKQKCLSIFQSGSF